MICRVSKECIDDHWGDPKTAGEFPDAAKIHSVAIENKVRSLIQSRRYEPDGSILVRSAEG